MIEILGIIPARSGSTGVKNKNIKIINNRHLIDYTIERAKKSKFITDIVASTDSVYYSNLFKKKVWIPELRPKKLSTNKSNIIKTLIHTTKLCEKIKIKDMILLYSYNQLHLLDLKMKLMDALKN